jgi:hypothetical protein
MGRKIFKGIPSHPTGSPGQQMDLPKYEFNKHMINAIVQLDTDRSQSQLQTFK